MRRAAGRVVSGAPIVAPSSQASSTGVSGRTAGFSRASALPRARQLTEVALESGGEIGRIFVADRVGDLRNRIFAGQKHFGGMLHAPFQNVVIDRETESFPEACFELGLVEADHSGKL